MIRTIHKMFWVWNFDKEEAWLNEMAAKGLALRSVGFFRYEFEDSEPGEYKVCLQYLGRKSRAESDKYIEFVENTGAEHIGTFVNWAYFRKKGDSDFSLFSDNASRVRYLTSILRFVIFITALNAYFALYNLFLLYVWGSGVNAVGFISLAVALLGAFGIVRLCAKRKKLKKEQSIFE